MKLINPYLSDDEKRNHSLPWIRAMAPAKKKEPATTEADSEMEEPKLEATKGKAKGTGKAAQASKSSGDLSEAMQKKRPEAPIKVKSGSRSGSPKAKSSRAGTPPGSSKDFQRGRAPEKVKGKARRRSQSPFENRHYQRRSPSPKDEKPDQLNAIQLMEKMLAEFKKQSRKN